MLSNTLTGSVLVLSLIILIRLFTFERHGARFRRCVSVTATLLMMACVTLIVQIATGAFVVQANIWPLVLIQVLLAIGLTRTKGNLAPMLGN